MESNPVAVVTGGASGMGAATVTKYLDEGWAVVALDRTVDGIDRRALAVEVDVVDRDAVKTALADQVPPGSLRAVANVAGVYPPTTLDTFSRDEFDRIFGVNVLGLLNVTAEAVPYLADGGSIVNFASVDAFTVSPGQLLYNASKAAVVMLTKTLALELAARRIRVNAIAPGWVDTPGNRATGRMEEAASSIPLGRVAHPDEIAQWVWILTGQGSAAFMTGETIVLSGGDVMR